MLTHDQKRLAFRIWLDLEEARNKIAATRSFVFLNGKNVDKVTMQVVDLQAAVEAVIVSGEIPPTPTLSFGGWGPGT